MKSKITVHDMTKMALLVALISVSAYLIIPLPFSLVSVTAQTLVINLTALLLEKKQALLTVVCWMLLGLVGVPVFSGGTAGIGRLLGPTGGYIFGFAAAAFLIAWLKGENPTFFRCLVLTILVGIPVIDSLGTLVYKFSADISWNTAVMSAVLPFIPGDLLKCLAASLLAVPLRKALAQTGRQSSVA